MAVLGFLTDIGIQKCREAIQNEGFRIVPSGFAVSRVATPNLSPAISAPNDGRWYKGPIAAREVVDTHTLRFICQVPASVTTQPDRIREIYLFCEDISTGQEYLLAVGQVTNELIYDPVDIVTLELEISILNFEFVDKAQFTYSQAEQVKQHRNDPNSHPDILKALNFAGIFVDAGNSSFRYVGQNYERRALFDGTRATGIYQNVRFFAEITGPRGNEITLRFDGISTVNKVIFDWNKANPDNTVNCETINHDGNKVLPQGTLTLSGGSLRVKDKDLVYKDVDGLYKAAIADGSKRAKVVGIVDLATQSVRSSGFVEYQHSYEIGSELFLSDKIAGALTTTPTSVRVGLAVGRNLILLNNSSSAVVQSDTGIGSGFDAVVTDKMGFGFYRTTQEAIDAVPNNSTILIDKLDELRKTLNLRNKRLSFVFAGLDTGWRRFAGAAEKQKIQFSTSPASGTWRIHVGDKKTSDLPFNASLQMIANELKTALNINEVQVTGSYVDGFEIVLGKNAAYDLISFSDAGENAKQRLTFSTVPTDGTFSLQHSNRKTRNIPYNVSATALADYIRSDLNLDVLVTNTSPNANSLQFDIEFRNKDGLQPIALLQVASSSLHSPSGAVTLRVVEMAAGRRPANNLRAGNGGLIEITVARLVAGEPVGDAKAVVVDTDGTCFTGKGIVEGFDIAIDVNNKKFVEIDVVFRNNGANIVNSPSSLSSAQPPIYYDASFGIGRQRILRVGVGCEFASILDALNAAVSGDLLEIYTPQQLTTPLSFDKSVTCVFLYDAALEFSFTNDVSYALRIASRRTILKNAKIVLKNTSTKISNFILIDNEHVSVDDCSIEISAGVTIDNLVTLTANCHCLDFDASLMRLTTTRITKIIQNSGGFYSNKAQVKDRDLGIVHELSAYRVQEVPTGNIDGSNRVFYLSQEAVNEASLIVKLDSQFLRINVDFRLERDSQNRLRQIRLSTAPARGQELYVDYFTYGFFAIPPMLRSEYLGLNFKYNNALYNNAQNLEIRGNANFSFNNAERSAVLEIPLGAGLGAPQNQTVTITQVHIAQKFVPLPSGFKHLIFCALNGQILIPDAQFKITNTAISFDVQTPPQLAENMLLHICYFGGV